MVSLILKSYLWDIDPESFNLADHADFIIERILEMGNEQAVQWVFKTFSKDDIKDVLRRTRRLSKQSAVFWSLILDLPSDEVRCLSKSFQKNYRAIWKR